MCGPAAPYVIQGIIALGGAALAVDSQNKAQDYQNKVDANNAQLARNQAADAAAQGDLESERSAWRTRAIEGQQRAAIAAQGIDSEFGTPQELLGETAMFGEMEQQQIRLDAARRAWGFNADARNTENQNIADRFSTKSRNQATIIGGLMDASRAATGAMGAGGGAANKFAKSANTWSSLKTGSNIKGGG